VVCYNLFGNALLIITVKEVIVMSILTVVAIDIGKAVAKSIFKFWMKDSELGQDISSSLIDLISSKTLDTLAQRKGNRQFEDIGDKISKDILPLLTSENIHLDEGERRAVAIEIVEMLNNSRLSIELLLQKNLQPIQLEQYLQTINANIARDFSEAGAFLYQRILQECCTYIVDISSQLPSFTQRTLAEVLEREDLISARVDQVLEELREIRKQLDPTVEVDRFEIEYRDAIARNLDVLQLIGADVSLQNRRYKLSVAYITLSVMQRSLFPSLTSVSFYKNTEDEAAREFVPVDITLASSNRLLIRGLAGSGKTTLLQWIAVRAATKSFEGQLAYWNDCIPFYIRLRHYAQSKLPKPEAFIDFTAPAIAGTMPKQWIHHVLRSGRAIVLVDGVDEISATQREEVHTWLRDLVETYKDNRFIVTSRPHAIEEGWMNHEEFNDAMLQEMELEDIFLFINHWHEAIKQELLTDEERKELGTLEEHLKERIKRTNSLRNLATNPLLCAMLCALNRERRRQLPVNRIELYEACCYLLLDRREKESHIDLSDYPLLNYSQKRRLLEDLAYWMTKESLSEAEKSIVDERFTRKLMNMPNIPLDTTGKVVRRLLVERSGIIREPVADQIDFTHRTFQEFFAAQAAVSISDIELLVTNAHSDQWREVVILAAGLAPSQALCEQLIDGLIKRGDKERLNCYQLHLVAVSCLETAIELGPEIKAEVEKRLSQLVPPKNVTDAKALAAAGDLAVPYLTNKGNKTVPLKKACIRTLALIRTEAAFQTIEEYLSDRSTTISEELFRAWDSFDQIVYAERVLLPIVQRETYLKLPHLLSKEELECLQYLRKVDNLEIINCKPIQYLGYLVDAKQLRKLCFKQCQQLTDLSHLAGLTQLTKLWLDTVGK
jgi:NACHT domain